MTQTTPKPAARIRGLLVLLPVAAGLVGLATRVSGETAGTGETPRQTRALPIRGVVRALEEATISTEIIASVSKIGFKEGQFFFSQGTWKFLDIKNSLARKFGHSCLVLTGLTRPRKRNG